MIRKFNMFSQLTILIALSTFALISCVPIDDRIVNGTDAAPGQVPYIVSFRKYNSHMCGGSIIDEMHILTAAHCVVYSGAEYMSIQFGTLDITAGQDAPNVIKVAKSTPHPNYVAGSGYKNDVAILTLEKPLVFGKYVQPITLPKPNNATPENTPAVLSGWGLSATGGQVMDTLQTVNITVYSDDDCERIHAQTGPTDRKYNVCAGVPEGGKGQCSGDSGGPLVAHGRQVGVVSWSVKPCTVRGYPGVFAKVSTQVDWIRDLIKSEKDEENH